MSSRAPGPEVVHGRHGLYRDFPLGELLDVAEEALLARLGERDGDALAAGAPGAADAVHVRLGRGRHVVVDDVRHIIDVEPAGGNIGSHQQFRRAVAKPSHHPIPLLLRQAAMQRASASVAAGAERLGEFIDFRSGSAEHDGRRRRFEIEYAGERRDLVATLHHVGDLAHERRLPQLRAPSAPRSSHALDRACASWRSPEFAGPVSPRRARSAAWAA